MCYYNFDESQFPLTGRLSCSFITRALLGSYILQAELGDLEDDDVTTTLLLEHKVAPAHYVTTELQEKVAELYKMHRLEILEGSTMK